MLKNREIIKKKRNDYDRETKIVMSYQYDLAYLIKETMMEFKEIPIYQIPDYIVRFQGTNKDSMFLASLNVEDKKNSHAEIRYDLKFGLRHPTDEKHPGFIVNVEMQHSDKVIYHLKNRAKYYVSRLISGQKNDPEGFQGNHYNQMKQVVSIWICMNHNKKKDNTMERFFVKNRITRLTTNALLNEQEESAEIIIVYPEENPIDVTSETNLSNFLNVLLRPNLLTKGEKFKILEEKYGILLVEEFKMK